MYHLLFVCLCVCVCVCTATDFSGEDKASGVKFCMVVHGRPGQGISHFGEPCSPEAHNRPANWRAASGPAIGMCG